MLLSVKNVDSASPADSSSETQDVPNWRRVLARAEAGFAGLRQHWQIICLVAIYLSMHLYVLSFAHELIFDEKIWIPEARAILLREPLYWVEYPHLSELFMAGGMYVFGDNSWGWRMPSVIFGAIGVVLVYLIALRLAGKRTAMLASALYVFENLAFTMTGLAMLDVAATTLMLLSFWLYLKKKYALAGISLAVGTVCSSKVVFGVVAILAHWLLTRRKEGSRKVALFAATALTTFFIVMPATDFLATGEWLNPFRRILNMLTWQSAQEATEEVIGKLGSTYPWQWITEPGGIRAEPTRFRYLFSLTPTIWVLIIPSIAYLLYRYFFVRKNRNTARFVLIWFGATYLLWIPLELITHKMMFLYYLFPTVGAICIAIGYAMHRAWERSKKIRDRNVGWMTRALLVIYLVVHFLLFLSLSPLLAPLIPQ